MYVGNGSSLFGFASDGRSFRTDAKARLSLPRPPAGRAFLTPLTVAGRADCSVRRSTRVQARSNMDEAVTVSAHHATTVSSVRWRPE